MARICIIRQLYYPLDPRVRREVESLEMAGHEVDIICLAQPDELRYEQNGRVTIRRLPLRRHRGSMLHYLLEYATFTALAGVMISLLHLRHRYELVQVNSIPDALVFSALVPKLLGARVLLDLHECMPEFFSTRFKTGLHHPMVRVVAWLEQASIRFADYAITCSEQMREAFVGRGATADKISVILNGSDESVFNTERYPFEKGNSGEFVLISHGTVEERYGLDTIIRAVALLKDEIPELRFDIYGEGSFKPDLQVLAKDLGVEDRVRFSQGFVPLDELVDAIALADAGVVAMKRDAFRDLTLCNKMYDFITMRKPALVSRTRSVEAYYGDSCFQMFTSDDERDLARAIRELHADPELRERLVQRASEVNEPYRWPQQRKLYQRIISSLIAKQDGALHQEAINSDSSSQTATLR